MTRLLLGKLAGMTTLAAGAEWVRLRAGWLRRGLPTTRASFPCAATTSLVLRAVEWKCCDSEGGIGRSLRVAQTTGTEQPLAAETADRQRKEIHAISGTTCSATTILLPIPPSESQHFHKGVDTIILYNLYTRVTDAIVPKNRAFCSKI